MRKKLPILLTTTLLMVMAFAAMMAVSANLGGFSMSPILPENQNPETRGFFDLRVVAGTRQEIAVAVSNSGEEYIDVSLSLVTASTNRNGIINYQNPGVDDVTLAHSFSEIGQITPGGELVTIPPGEAAIVPIFIDIPEEGFDGIILGSVHALLEITEEQRAATAGMIVNRFAHVVVVRLQERDTEIAANFELGEVRADLVNHRASIVAELRNTQPRLSMGALVHAQIYPIGSDEPIFARENVNVDFAPNTIFEFSMIDEAGFGLHPGDYLARIRVEHGGVQWDFERDFEILPQQAEAINAAAVNIQQQHPMVADDSDVENDFWSNILSRIEDNILLIGGIGLLVLAAAVTVIAVILARNNKRNSKKRSSAMTDEELQRRLESLGVKTANADGSGGDSSDLSSLKSKPSSSATETATTTAAAEMPPRGEDNKKKENIKVSVRMKKGK